MSDAKKTQAVAIRDAALEIIRRLGKHQTTAGKTPVRITAAEVDGLNISHNTPFTPQPAPSEAMQAALAKAGRAPLPYTLDIWDRKAKTFSIAWSDAELRVTTFKKGPWTDRLKAAALEA